MFADIRWRDLIIHTALTFITHHQYCVSQWERLTKHLLLTPAKPWTNINSSSSVFSNVQVINQSGCKESLMYHQDELTSDPKWITRSHPFFIYITYSTSISFNPIQTVHLLDCTSYLYFISYLGSRLYDILVSLSHSKTRIYSNIQIHTFRPIYFAGCKPCHPYYYFLIKFSGFGWSLKKHLHYVPSEG